MLMVGSTEHLPLWWWSTTGTICAAIRGHAVATQQSPNIPPQQTFSSTFSVTDTYLQFNVLRHGSIQHLKPSTNPMCSACKSRPLQQNQARAAQTTSPGPLSLQLLPRQCHPWISTQRALCVLHTLPVLPSLPSPSFKSSILRIRHLGLPWPLFPDASWLSYNSNLTCTLSEGSWPLLHSGPSPCMLYP